MGFGSSSAHGESRREADAARDLKKGNPRGCFPLSSTIIEILRFTSLFVTDKRSVNLSSKGRISLRSLIFLYKCFKTTILRS